MSIHSRGQYARINVEIDLDKPLKSFIMIRGHKLFLEYEGLHLICFHCGRYGHKVGQCDKLPEVPKVQVSDNKLPEVSKVQASDIVQEKQKTMKDGTPKGT